MIYAILAIGVALVSISLWEIKRLRDESENEIENIQLMKKEIRQAKNDVEKLLLELNKASERAVHEFVQKIEQQKEKLTQQLDFARELEIAVAATSEETEKEEEVSKGQIDFEFTPDQYETPEKHLKVYQMSDEGLTPGEIARKTKMGKGEVALILNLRRGEQKNVQVLQ